MACVTRNTPLLVVMVSFGFAIGVYFLKVFFVWPIQYAKLGFENGWEI